MTWNRRGEGPQQLEVAADHGRGDGRELPGPFHGPLQQPVIGYEVVDDADVVGAAGRQPAAEGDLRAHGLRE
jgi:hypothetical protein